MDNDRLVHNVDVIENFSNSDHNTVTFCVAGHISGSSSGIPDSVRSVLNHDLLHEILGSIDWTVELEGLADVNDMWTAFHDRVTNAVQ